MEYKNLNPIPMYPEYGYDDAEAIDMDIEYMKEMQPQAVRMIQREVDEECDKLEYEGSCMFDEYPSCEHLGTIIDAIYDRIIRSNPEEMQLNADQLRPPNVPPWGPPPFRPPMGPGPSRPPRPGRPDFRPDRNPDWLRHLISNLLSHEMMHRRRRFRRRRRPYRTF